MSPFNLLPLPGGGPSVALAAASVNAGTVIVAVITLVFIGLIWVGSRPSVMARYSTDEDADADEGAAGPDAPGASGKAPARKRPRR